jgi:hypothetical protein
VAFEWEAGPTLASEAGPESMAAEPSGWDAMGKPVPFARREAAERHMREMGYTDREVIFGTVQGMSEALGHDRPHAAIKIGMDNMGKDLGGVYRIMAVLCCG